MRAVVYEAFGARPKLQSVPDPVLPADGVVIEVRATGICRSDWHGWVGHDPSIELPHVPGHEFAGVVLDAGRDVRHWRQGDRVTVPFVVACGGCPQCHAGHQQVCEHQVQPGFTCWGSFAEAVAIERADTNLVRLPEDMSFGTAASLGCRFATSFRAVVDQGRVSPGEWVAVHGCGGVGLSAVMIASSLGANVIAVDLSEEALALAKDMGAAVTVNAGDVGNVVEAVADASGGGVHASIDALGHPATCFNSIANLRIRGRHVQVGLMTGDHASPAVPMDLVIAKELEILGSHGMQAHRYDAMIAMIQSGALKPDQLVRQEISLGESIEAMMHMDGPGGPGATVVTTF
ncbi:MAG: zinc-dependent alcohol dehydrogenase family protein [Pseudomonadota bacterium]